MMMTLAAVFCCAMTLTVAMTSCGKDEVKDITESPMYKMGFESMSGGYETLTEMNTIKHAFMEALGVTDDIFTFNGGDDKVKQACQQAANMLNTMTFVGHYNFVVRRVTKDTPVIFSWNVN